MSSFVYLRSAGPEKILQCIELQREWNVTAIAEKGHFENSQKLRARGVINPFRKRVIVPHLPEEAADQRAQCERKHDAPVALAQFFEKMRSARPVVNRFENQNERNPDEWIKDFRPSEQQY